jgi:hypothetical protein
MKVLMVAALGAVTLLAADAGRPDALAGAIKSGQRAVAIEMIANKSAEPERPGSRRKAD